MRFFKTLVICLPVLFMVCCKKHTMNNKSDKYDTTKVGDTISYNDNWIPFYVLKQKIGPKLSDIRYMDSIYGQPIEMQSDVARYGKIGSLEYEIDDVSDKISNIPKCELKTYIWDVDSIRLLTMYYIVKDDNLIPIWGFQYNPATINVE